MVSVAIGATATRGCEVEGVAVIFKIIRGLRASILEELEIVMVPPASPSKAPLIKVGNRPPPETLIL